jgi:hypothetical protein
MILTRGARSQITSRSTPCHVDWVTLSSSDARLLTLSSEERLESKDILELVERAQKLVNLLLHLILLSSCLVQSLLLLREGIPHQSVWHH